VAELFRRTSKSSSLEFVRDLKQLKAIKRSGCDEQSESQQRSEMDMMNKVNHSFEAK
jgi:hypothetical protein